MSYSEDNTLETSPDISYNHINYQVFQLLEDLEAAGQTSSPRGLKTKEANLATLDIDPLYSVIDFQPRRFNWRYFAGELAWYLKGDNSIDFINNFSSFWKDICPSGKANSNYGSLLFKPHPSSRGGLTDSSGVNQLEWVYNSLVKDINTRQAVAFFNAPYFQYEGNRDFVCTMYVNFWIRKNHLEMKVQMRSNDIFFGLSYDAPWFSTLHQSMFLNLKKVYPDLKLGMYYHCADNIHFYERHFELAESILDSGVDTTVRMELKAPLFEFVDGKIQLSKESDLFIETVDDIISTGNIKRDQIFWKNTLEGFFDITGDTLV